MEHHWASDPFTFSTNSAKMAWWPVLWLTLDSAFQPMPTHVQDVVPMTVMSSWCDLCWQGQCKVSSFDVVGTKPDGANCASCTRGVEDGSLRV
jgi:hypothetical protein